jgi:hypothetical protein
MLWRSADASRVIALSAPSLLVPLLAPLVLASQGALGSWRYLLALASWLVPLSTLARGRHAGSTIEIRSLFATRSYFAPETALGVVVRGGRSPSVHLVLDDGRQQSYLGTWLGSAARATRHADFLRERWGCSRTSAAALRLAADERARQEAQAAVDSYYRSPRWRRTVLIGLLTVLLYVAGILAFLVFRRSP